MHGCNITLKNNPSGQLLVCTIPGLATVLQSQEKLSTTRETLGGRSLDLSMIAFVLSERRAGRGEHAGQFSEHAMPRIASVRTSLVRCLSPLLLHSDGDRTTRLLFSSSNLILFCFRRPTLLNFSKLGKVLYLPQNSFSSIEVLSFAPL